VSVKPAQLRNTNKQHKRQEKNTKNHTNKKDNKGERRNPRRGSKAAQRTEKTGKGKEQIVSQNDQPYQEAKPTAKVLR